MNEIRLIVSPEMLSSLITELQLHQGKLETIRKNGDQINSLIKHIHETKPNSDQNDAVSDTTDDDSNSKDG